MIARSFSSGSKFLHPSPSSGLPAENSVSCGELTDLTDLTVPESKDTDKDLDQKIADNYCDGEIQLEDSIQKLR